MNFLNKLESKFEKYTIPKLYFVIIICIVIGYLLRVISPELYSRCILEPYHVVVLHQYWRLFTWIFTNPYSLSLVMIIILPINLFFYYSLGSALERYWGRFLYNLYIIGGAILTDVLILLGAFYYYYWSSNAETHRLAGYTGDSLSAGLSVTRFMLISIFLAFTVVGGDNMVYLYFVIPLKMKWLGYVDLVLLAYYFVTGGLFTKIIVFSSIANYIIYVLLNKGMSSSPLRRKSQNNYVKSKQKKKKKPNYKYNEDGTIMFPGRSGIIEPGTGNPKGITIHKCAVCGRTEEDDPNLEFRFCSKCEGNYEYCSDHLYTHTHVKN